MKRLIFLLLLSASLVFPHTSAHARSLIFSDEFNGALLDTSKWSTCYWFGCTNYGNNELEWYQSNNIAEADGLLSLTAQKQIITTFPYTSGMITSDGHFSYLYGYAEIRAKTVSGKGLWPAFWLIPTDHSWPPEIDILEQIGQTPNVNYMTVHYEVGKNASQSGTTYTGTDFSTDFHIYGVDWEPNYIIWYIDGVERAKYTNRKYIPNKPMYLVANLAVGGNFPGSPDLNTVFPANFQIDYIRVYK